MTEVQQAEDKHIDGLIAGMVDDPKEEKPKEEVAAEPKAEEGPKEEIKEEPKPEEKERKVVSHAALHEERERRKELQRKLEQEAERTRTLESRLNQLLEANKPTQEEVDPIQRLEKVEKTISQTAEQQEAARKHQEFIGRYQASAHEFTKDQPDFNQAYQYLLDSRRKELSALIKDPVKLAHAVANDEFSLVQAAYENEENPAAVIYEMAKHRGYNNQPAAPVKAETPKPDIAQIDKGLKASKSLGSGGAKADADANVDSLSAHDIASMSDAEFESLVKQHAPRGYKH